MYQSGAEVRPMLASDKNWGDYFVLSQQQQIEAY